MAALLGADAPRRHPAVIPSAWRPWTGRWPPSDDRTGPEPPRRPGRLLPRRDPGGWATSRRFPQPGGPVMQTTPSNASGCAPADGAGSWRRQARHPPRGYPGVPVQVIRRSSKESARKSGGADGQGWRSLTGRLDRAVRGALNRASRTSRPRPADIDWNRTRRRQPQNCLPNTAPWCQAARPATGGAGSASSAS